MTKEITKANILQEIQNKFGLRDFEPERFLFGEFVTPVYDIEHHVKTWTTIRYRTQVTGNGAVAILLVPGNKEYNIRRVNVLHETGANFDIDQVFFDGQSNAVQYLFYDTAAPITSGTVKIFALTQDIIMSKNDLKAFYYNVSNFVAGGYVSVHVTLEDVTVR